MRRDEALDLAPFRQHVAAMASDLADLVRRRGASPEQLAEVIARSYAYRGDGESYDDLQNADLVRVIERRKGLPVALSILYLHVARAQGWDAEGLAFPAHFLIRVGIDGRAPRGRSRSTTAWCATPPTCAACCARCWGRTPSCTPSISTRCPTATCCCGSRTMSACGSPSARTGRAPAQSLERMLAIAPDRPELLFEAGQLNARLDKRRAAIAAFERFLDLEGDGGDPGLRQRAHGPVAGIAPRA